MIWAELSRPFTFARLAQILTQALIGQKLYPQTAAETAAGVAPVSYAYPPGNVFRYCTAAQIGNIQGNIVQDVSGPIQNAINCTTGDVYFPSGYYYIGKPLYITAGSVQNLRLIGESRTNTYIQPSAASIADANGINALIINQKDNGKFSMRHIRLSSQVAAYTGISISAVLNGPAAQKPIFSGGIDDCWFDTGSTNAGFFNGFMSNVTVTNCTWEFQKGVFNFPNGASNVQFVNCTLSNCYDYFVQTAFDGTNHTNIMSVESLQVYTHNRGVLFNLTGDYAWSINDVLLQASTGGANLGGIGIGTFTNCTDIQLSQLNAVATVAGTTGALDVALTFDACTGQVSDSIFDGCDTGIVLTGGVMRLSFDHVDIVNTVTAALRTTTASSSGIVTASHCNWSDGNDALILCSVGVAFDFLVSASRLMNAGLTAGNGARNITMQTSGLAVFDGCQIGQNNGAAAAGYYFDGEGTGTFLALHCNFTGAPPIGLSTGAQILHNVPIPPTPVAGFGTPTGGAVIVNFPGASATLLQTSETVAEILTVLQGAGLIAS